MKKAPRLTPRQFRPKPGSEQLYRKALQRLHEDLASAAGLEEVRKTGKALDKRRSPARSSS